MSDEHPFITYLADVLPSIESGSLASLPLYAGPSTPQMESIMRSITNIASRHQAAQDINTSDRRTGSIAAIINTSPTSDSHAVDQLHQLKEQTQAIAQVTSALAAGDFNAYVHIPVQEDLLPIKSSVNQVADKLLILTRETMRVSLEVGTEGILGAQSSQSDDMGGTWKEAIDRVNLLAMQMTNMIRATGEALKAAALGDLSIRVTVPDARGELLDFKCIVNGMLEHINSIASEADRKLKELKVGLLDGAPAQVDGASGVWKELLNTINERGLSSQTGSD